MRVIALLSVAMLLFAADFEWFGYKDALKKAQQLHRPIMVMITQKGCATCEYMDEVAFEDEELVDFIEYNFIPVKLTIEEAKKVGLKAYGTPTFYFLDENGKKIARPLAGGTTAKNFLAKLKEIKRGL